VLGHKRRMSGDGAARWIAGAFSHSWQPACDRDRGVAYTAGTQARRRGQFSQGWIGAGGKITWDGRRDRKNPLSAARGHCVGTIQADGTIKYRPNPSNVTGWIQH
jgi:hypothetical protein